MTSKTALTLSAAALLLAGALTGWFAHALTAPGHPPAPVHAFENRGARGAPNAPPVTAKPADTAPGTVSSSLAAGFDFPPQWDAMRCARESLKELNEFRRMQMFQRAMQRLTPESAARMQEVFDETAAAGKWYFTEYPFFLRRWAEIDGRAAVEFAVNRGGHDRNGWNSLIRRTLSGWAVNDPEAAVAWINSKEEVSGWVQSASVSGVIDGLTERDPDRAVEFVLAQSGGDDLTSQYSILTDRLIYGPGMARAEQWLNTIPEAPEYADAKRQVSAQIIDRLLRGEPDEAAALIRRHADGAWLDPGSVRRVAQALRKKPGRYEAWRDSLPAGFALETVSSGSP